MAESARAPSSPRPGIDRRCGPGTGFGPVYGVGMTCAPVAAARSGESARRRPLPRLIIPVLVAGLSLLGSGCTPDQPPPLAPASSPAGSPTTSQTPGEDDFTFEDAAEFEDGLTIEISGAPLARRAGDHEKGAESTNGELVVIAVLITNEGTEPFAAQDALITLQYQGVEDAPLIVDDTGDLRAGFGEPVPPDSDATATLGFAVPFSAIGSVAVTVDPGDDLNEPVTFIGAAEREDEGG